MFFVHTPRSNRRTDSYADGSNDVVSLKDDFLGVWTMSDVIWEYMHQKGAWIGSFKPKRQHLYIAIYLELLIRRTSDLKTEFRPRKTLRGWSTITQKQIQHGWLTTSWKSIWHHKSAVHGPIWTKFGILMQIYTPITAKCSRLKPGPEVEFQYGGRLFFKNGSSYISAVDWDMSTRFGLLIDLTFWRQWHQQTRNRK